MLYNDFLVGGLVRINIINILMVFYLLGTNPNCRPFIEEMKLFILKQFNFYFYFKYYLFFI